MDEEQELPSTGWETFLGWAGRFRSMPNFEDDEITYKFRALEPLERARSFLLSAGNWRDDLRRGFANQHQNLVSHWAYTPFLDWVGREPDVAGRALRALWEWPAPAGVRIDEFAAILPAGVVSGDGSRANLASYLLTSIRPLEWPVYRVTAFEQAFELTRVNGPPRGASAGERYEHALGFLVELAERGRGVGIDVRHLLDAQSLVWCVTMWQRRPDAFTPDEWDDLLLFRSAPSRAKAASVASAVRRVKAKVLPPRPVCPLCGESDEVRLVGRVGDRRWEFSCEAGPGHVEPCRFTATGR